VAPDAKADYREAAEGHPEHYHPQHRHPEHYTDSMTKCHHPLQALTVAATLCLCLWSLPAAAQWMWRGADGRVTASDRPPPPGVAEKDIIKRPAADNRGRLPGAAAGNAAGAAGAAAEASAATGAASAPVAAASAPATALEREAQARKLAAQTEKAAKARADEDRQAAVRAINCSNARSQAASLESGVRVVRTNEKGEREILDDRGRQQELTRARDAIASDCR